MKLQMIIKKEILDGIRNYRFLTLTAAYMFFAIFNPIMNKFVLPQLLRSQFPNMTEELIADMLENTQIASVTGYLNSIFEMGMLIGVFVLCGILAQEISEKTLIIPVSTGKGYRELVMGKVIVYGTALLSISIISIFVNYLYSGVLFGFEIDSVIPVLRGGLFHGLYMVFVLGLLLLTGSFAKKPIVTGLIVLIPAYSMGFIGNLLDINYLLPSGLLAEASNMTGSISNQAYQTIITTLVLFTLLVAFTIMRLKRIELAKG